MSKLTRKIALELIYSADHRNTSKNNTKTFSGSLVLVKNRVIICTINFWIDDTQIHISSFDTEAKYRRCGYGRLLMEYMMFTAEILKLPIYLYSSNEGIPFYESIGMEHATSPKILKKLVVINDNPENPYEWDSDEFIWIPKCLRRKRKIWLFA